MDLNVMQIFFVNLIIIFLTHSSCRSTEKEQEPEDEVEIQLIVKRDAPLNGQELPFVEGRTFRASEPINPNTPTESEQSDSPQPLFGETFQTSQTIFQPEVDNDDGTGVHSEITDRGDESRESLTRSRTRTGGYAAQYPYYQTSSEGQVSSDRQTRGPQSSTYTTSSNSYQRNSQRRVFGYGGSDGVTSNPRYQTQSQTRIVAYGGGGSGGIPGSFGQTSSRTQNYGGRRVDSSSTSGQYVGGSIRYENGRYYDSAGNEVDPYGRHRDSSGRLVGSSSNTLPCCDGFTQPGYPTTYDPIISRISNDPICPTTNVRVRINGHLCSDAISQLGRFICYNYERVSSECCERCLQVKNPSQVGCEYGDRSYQCTNIQPFDCYVERNRQICCDRCRIFREQMQTTATPNCAYGDLTPRCSNIRQRPHLCYLQENQRLCCATCPRLANNAEPGCMWGNQNPEVCEPFDREGQLRLNCYMPAVQEFCCLTCKRLRARMRDEIPGCEYGDSPVQFSTGIEILDCSQYISQFGVQNCADSEIASKCCYTCYRYRTSGRG